MATPSACAKLAISSPTTDSSASSCREVWWGERRVVRIGFATALAFYPAVGFTSTIGQLLWVSGLCSLFGAGLRPALTSLITQKAGKREQGVIIGLTQSLMSIAQIAAPVIAGLMINANDRSHDPRYLTLWAVWGGVLAGAALFFEPRTRDARAAF